MTVYSPLLDDSHYSYGQRAIGELCRDIPQCGVLLRNALGGLRDVSGWVAGRELLVLPFLWPILLLSHTNEYEGTAGTLQLDIYDLFPHV